VGKQTAKRREPQSVRIVILRTALNSSTNIKRTKIYKETCGYQKYTSAYPINPVMKSVVCENKKTVKCLDVSLLADGIKRIISHKDSTINLPKILKLHRYAMS